MKDALNKNWQFGLLGALTGARLPLVSTASLLFAIGWAIRIGIQQGLSRAILGVLIYIGTFLVVAVLFTWFVY
jgi:hypothetical protein